MSLYSVKNCSIIRMISAPASWNSDESRRPALPAHVGGVVHGVLAREGGDAAQELRLVPQPVSHGRRENCIMPSI